MIATLEVIESSYVMRDFRYVTEHNFTGKKVFDRDQVLLEPGAASHFLAAVADFWEQGYFVVVWDAFRTPDEQRKLLQVCDDARYVATDSNHCKGLAVDITLADSRQAYLDMGTDFDCFSEEAHSDYTNLSKEQLKNRQCLTETMHRHGFAVHPYEWWHFDFVGKA